MYMPNLVLHTVWNVSPTVALGDNPLYTTSFDEFMGSGEEFKWMSDRIILKNKDKRWFYNTLKSTSDKKTTIKCPFLGGRPF